MKIRITMTDGECHTFINNHFDTLGMFISNQLKAKFYILSKDGTIAIRTNSISKVERLKDD